MSKAEIPTELREALAELEARNATLPQIRADGEAALRRLVELAQGHTGQARRVGLFLLGLYNGEEFRFDLTDLRALDFGVFDDCIAVLRMDHQPLKEVHRYFSNGNALFSRLADKWCPRQP